MPQRGEETYDSYCFESGEVDGCQHVPMRLQKRRPIHRALSTWRWLDTVVFENVANGLVRDIMPQIGQGSLYSIISPRRILAGHLDHKIDDFLAGSWSSRRLATLRVIPFLSDQLAISAENCIGRKQGTDFLKPFLAQDLSLDR